MDLEYTLEVMEIKDSIKRIRETVENTAVSCGRNPGDIRIIAVSKRFPADRIIEAGKAGQVLFGENQVQEASIKVKSLAERNIEWHLIGHLQSNKARIAARIFDCIQTVDRARIAVKLNALAEEFGKKLSVMAQVNVGGEEQKAGIEPEYVGELVAVIDGCPNLKLEGLMTIPPFAEDPEDTRIYFRKLRELRDTLNLDRTVLIKELSMGMSHDFKVAIQEGATMIRVGTAIFGQRPPIGTKVT